MALTNAEKQRRYREKRDKDPTRRAEYLNKKKQKYIEDVAVGKRLLIESMSERSQRQQRKAWREDQKRSRRRKKEKNIPIIPTPPISPSDSDPQQRRPVNRRRERSKAKCYRDNQKLQEQLRNERKKKNMHMKRWIREKMQIRTSQSHPILHQRIY